MGIRRRAIVANRHFISAGRAGGMLYNRPLNGAAAFADLAVGDKCHKITIDRVTITRWRYYHYRQRYRGWNSINPDGDRRQTNDC